MSVAHVIVEADGGSRGNPGPAGYGAVVLDAATGAVLVESNDAIGVATNNVAEYRGLIAGLRAARDLGATRVSVRMDSKLVVEQMKGTWQVKSDALRALAREAAALRQGFDEIGFEWIPRARNAYADRLANEAMDRVAGRPVGAAVAPFAGRPAAPPPGSWAPRTDRATSLVLIRHGATSHSAQRRFSGRNDLPLDEVGQRQAAALAVRRFGDVAAVLSSPLPRSVQTAQAIAHRLGLTVETVDDFAEADFGRWEGLTFAQVREQDPGGLDAWLSAPDAAPPGGESFTAVARRMRAAREAADAAHPGATVVIVTHVTPIKTLIRLALDAPPAAMFRLHLDTASVSMLDYYPDGACSLRLFNDTSHL